MQPLAQPQPGPQLTQCFWWALQLPVTQYATQCHFLLLAAAVARPVKPVQMALVVQLLGQRDNGRHLSPPLVLLGVKFQR